MPKTIAIMFYDSTKVRGPNEDNHSQWVKPVVEECASCKFWQPSHHLCENSFKRGDQWHEQWMYGLCRRYRDYCHVKDTYYCGEYVESQNVKTTEAT